MLGRRYLLRALSGSLTVNVLLLVLFRSCNRQTTIELQDRYRPRFFDQVRYETMYASSGNKNFFTKSCHRQTYQNYEQSRQKLGTILGNKVPQKSKFSKNIFNKSWSPSPIFFKEIFFGKIQPIFNTEK